ncbi:hypothetical protein FTX61_11630 [Nitriliruptoraceae bacterium ZYF776]|nr:hypothetical protein [Profundirhabdus halotolerans]
MDGGGLRHPGDGDAPADLPVLREAFDGLPDAVWVFDGATLRHANPSARALPELLAAPEVAALRSRTEASGGPEATEVHLAVPGAWFEVTAHPGDRALTLHARDVTEARRLATRDRLRRSLPEPGPPRPGAGRQPATIRRTLEALVAFGLPFAEAWRGDEQRPPHLVGCAHDGSEPMRWLAVATRGAHPDADSVVGRCVLEGRPSRLDDLATVDAFQRRDVAEACGLHAAVHLPVTPDDGARLVVGVLHDGTPRQRELADAVEELWPQLHALLDHATDTTVPPA